MGVGVGVGLWRLGLQDSTLDQARMRLQSKGHLLLQLTEDKGCRRHESASKGGRGAWLSDKPVSSLFFTELGGVHCHCPHSKDEETEAQRPQATASNPFARRQQSWWLIGFSSMS